MVTKRQTRKKAPVEVEPLYRMTKMADLPEVFKVAQRLYRALPADDPALVIHGTRIEIPYRGNEGNSGRAWMLGNRKGYRRWDDAYYRRNADIVERLYPDGQHALAHESHTKRCSGGMDEWEYFVHAKAYRIEVAYYLPHECRRFSLHGVPGDTGKTGMRWSCTTCHLVPNKTTQRALSAKVTP